MQYAVSFSKLQFAANFEAFFFTVNIKVIEVKLL